MCKRKCKIYECKTCLKTFSDNQVSKVEDLCLCCETKVREKYNERKRFVNSKKPKRETPLRENYEELANVYEKDN